MEIWIDGKRAAMLPSMPPEEKLRQATIKLSRYWNTPLRSFWRNAYIHFRDALKSKGSGKQDERSPEPDGSGGKPAA